jgi:hypothetical protein
MSYSASEKACEVHLRALRLVYHLQGDINHLLVLSWVIDFRTEVLYIIDQFSSLRAIFL